MNHESHLEQKEFLLHLYDKLWENISQKEGRLWTFLSVYAAAIGLIVSSGLGVSQRYITCVIVVIMTYWACEIVDDADWWSIRNRLMVVGIERKAETAGVVPESFQGPKFSTNRLYNVCALVFVTIGVGEFAFYVLGEISKSVSQLLLVEVLYAVALYAVYRCLSTRAKLIKQYYEYFRELNDEWADPASGRAGAYPEDRIAREEEGDRVQRSWRVQGLLVYVAVTACVAVAVRTIAARSLLTLAGLQIGVVGLLIWSQHRHRRMVQSYYVPFGGRQKTLLNLLVVGGIFVSLGVPVVVGSLDGLPWQAVEALSPDHMAKVVLELGRLEADLRALQALKDRALSDQLLQVEREIAVLKRAINEQRVTEEANRALLERVTQEVELMKGRVDPSKRGTTGTP